MFISRSNDRRVHQKNINFPFTDSSGVVVASDRRTGSDRRKNQAGSAIAMEIMGIMN